MLLKDVLVADSLKRRLVKLVDENRISHAQLFLGNSGSHSFALAIAYAQYICCEDSQDGDSCGKCHSCVMFEKLQHPDLHLIFPNCTNKAVPKDSDSNAHVNVFRNFVFTHDYHIDFEDWVQELKAGAKGENKQVTINIRDCANIVAQNSIRSYENGYKIYILWMAEKLYHQAAPKLLKTLEEPENKTLFILLAENSDSMLPTILSRTQLVRIPPMEEFLIKTQLIENEQVGEQEASDIAAISGGSYVKALRLSKDNSELRHLLMWYNVFMKSVTAYVQRNDLNKIAYHEVQGAFDEVISEGRDMQKKLFIYFSRMFRNELHLNKKCSFLVKSTADEFKVLDQYHSFFTVKNAGPLLQYCNEAILHIDRNVNSKLVFTDFYFKVAASMMNK